MEYRIKAGLMILLLVTLPYLPLAARASEFPGKGDKQTWEQACSLSNASALLFQSGQVKEAFEGFYKSIELYSQDAVLLYNVGLAHQQYAYLVGTPDEKKEQLKKAEEWFEKAGLIKPEASEIRIHLANVQCELAKYQDSLGNLQKILALSTLSQADRQSTLLAVETVKAKMGKSQHDDSKVAPTSTSGWQSYSDVDTGFSINYPDGWKVERDSKTGQIEVFDDSGSKLTVLPFSTEKKIEPSVAPAIFKTFVKVLAPQESWSEPQRIGDNALRSTYANEKESAVAVISFQSTSKGSSGQAAVAKFAGSGGRFPTDKFAQMLSSLRFSGTAASSAQTSSGSESDDQSEDRSTTLTQEPTSEEDETLLQKPQASFSGWTTFTDPDQRSFTVEVPIGWKVEGGMVRPRPIDARPWVKTTSPDGMITAFIGDGKIPGYTMPNAQMTSLGFFPGKWYNGSLIAGYIPAREFIEKYAMKNMKALFSDIQVVEEHNHPDVAAAVNGTVGASKSEAASIKLTANYGDIPAVAYYLGCTKATIGYGTGMWWVTKIAGEVSPADRDMEGLSVILHMLGTFKINPEWGNAAVNTAGQVSRNFTASSQQVSNSIMNRYWSQQAANENIHSAYWNRQKSQDRAANNFSNYIRGVENVRDPDTGTNYQVQYGPRYHWTDGQGNYQGTDYSAPSPEWRQLLSVP